MLIASLIESPLLLKRGCGKHKVQLANFDMASLLIIWFRWRCLMATSKPPNPRFKSEQHLRRPVGTLSRLSSCSVVPSLRVEILSNLRFQTFCQSLGRWTTPGGTGNVGVDPHFELSMICCAFLIADSSGALSFFRMSIVFCAEAVASFLLPSFA